ncbi:MAG: hypothetical protein KKH92_06060 [Firmicutes bacterium]|nr:hypothetical protein [Bacillota bacterium]
MIDTRSYKNGLIEGVVFCFYKDNKVLLEDRGKGFNVEAFFPNGTIEIKDKNSSDDYIVNALFREVSEEFKNRINILDKAFLGELIVPEINVLFYIFVITDWEGDFPDEIQEIGEPDSKISFFSIDEARTLFKYQSAFEMLDRVLNYIKREGNNNER